MFPPCTSSARPRVWQTDRNNRAGTTARTTAHKNSSRNLHQPDINREPRRNTKQPRERHRAAALRCHRAKRIQTQYETKTKTNTKPHLPTLATFTKLLACKVRRRLRAALLPLSPPHWLCLCGQLRRQDPYPLYRSEHSQCVSTSKSKVGASGVGPGPGSRREKLP